MLTTRYDGLIDKWTRELTEIQQQSREETERLHELEDQLRTAQQEMPAVEQQRTMLNNQIQQVMARNAYGGYYQGAPPQLQEQMAQVARKADRFRMIILNNPQGIKSANDTLDQNKAIISKLKVSRYGSKSSRSCLVFHVPVCMESRLSLCWLQPCLAHVKI
jgi:septal ring factor EnvC (AmiA/AmiB activator)